MKKLLRYVLCTVALMLTLCTGALAAGQGELSIEFNGEPLSFTDAAPRIVQNRTYLPFRAVFNALGFADENITFDASTRRVCAVGEDVEVSMVVGEKKITVVREGNTIVLDTDVPAFIAPEVNRTFVPVGFVAQAMGYRVVWNGELRTVFIDDVESILSGNKETYKLLDKYLAYSRKFREKNYTVEGVFTANEDGMEMSGPCSMLMAGDGKYDLDMAMTLTGKTDGVDLGMIIPEGLTLSIRGDRTSGDFYFRSDMGLTAAESGMENLWFKMNMAQAEGPVATLPSMFYLDALDLNRAEAEKMDGKTLVHTMAQGDATVSVAHQLAVYNGLFSDSAFEKIDRGYMSCVKAGGVEMTLILHTSGSQVNGYTVTMSAVADGGGVKAEVLVKGEKICSAYELMSDGSSTTMKLEGTCTTTRREPIGAPDENALVLDMTGQRFR